MKKVLCVILALATAASVAACSGGSNSGTSSASPSKSGSSEKAAVDPMGKYDPPIEITVVKGFDDPKFDKGDSIDNNPFTRLYSSDLGIKYKYLWTTSGAQFQQKMTLSIASGDLPDFMPLTPQQFNMCLKNGMLADITDVFGQYASEEIKKNFASVPDSMALAKVDGKLMALPQFQGTVDQTQFLWVRQDWLKKLGLPNPKTMDDVYRIMEAFAKDDPDGDGKNDTVGLVAEKGIVEDNWASLLGFFEGFHAYPTGWVKKSDGTLQFGAIQPEAKAALEKLQQLYKDGFLDKEFAVMTPQKSIEALVSEKAGMVYSGLSAPITVKDLSTKNPKAEFVPYPLPSVDGQAASNMIQTTVGTFFGVNKKSKNPEAMIKMMNLMKVKGTDRELSVTKAGNEIWMYNVDLPGVTSPTKNYDCYVDIQEAFSKNDPSKLNAEEKQYYDYIVKYNKGDNSDNMAFGYAKVFGPGQSSGSVIDAYMKNKLMLSSAFGGILSDKNQSKTSILKSLRDETYTKIIMGEEPAEKFDDFVKMWYSQGGTDITKEVNESNGSQK